MDWQHGHLALLVKNLLYSALIGEWLLPLSLVWFRFLWGGVSVSMYVSLVITCRGQRTDSRSEFSPSPWDPLEITLRSSGLHHTCSNCWAISLPQLLLLLMLTTQVHSYIFSPLAPDQIQNTHMYHLFWHERLILEKSLNNLDSYLCSPWTFKRWWTLTCKINPVLIVEIGCWR